VTVPLLAGLAVILVVLVFGLLLFGSHSRRRAEAIADQALAYIDQLDGKAFEFYLADLFDACRETAMVTSGGGGDFGGDLIVGAGRRRRVVQAKRWDSAVGIDAVYAVNGARTHYRGGRLLRRRPRALLITTSWFTKPAQTHAQETGVELWERKRFRQEMVTRQLRASSAARRRIRSALLPSKDAEPTPWRTSAVVHLQLTSETPSPLRRVRSSRAPNRWSMPRATSRLPTSTPPPPTAHEVAALPTRNFQSRRDLHSVPYDEVEGAIRAVTGDHGLLLILSCLYEGSEGGSGWRLPWLTLLVVTTIPFSHYALVEPVSAALDMGRPVELTALSALPDEIEAAVRAGDLVIRDLVRRGRPLGGYDRAELRNLRMRIVNLNLKAAARGRLARVWTLLVEDRSDEAVHAAIQSVLLAGGHVDFDFWRPFRSYLDGMGDQALRQRIDDTMAYAQSQTRGSLVEREAATAIALAGLAEAVLGGDSP